MDQNQISAVKLVLDNLKEKDIEEELSEHFADQEDIRSIVLHTLTVSDFIVHFKKAIGKLDTTLQSDKVHFLPFQYNFQNEYGGGNLETLLTSILNHIDSKDFPNAQIFTSHLIYYEIVNRIYEAPRFPKNTLRIIKINETEDRLGLLSNQIGKYSEKISEALNKL